MIFTNLAATDIQKKQIRDLIKGKTNPETYSSVYYWLIKCYNRPSQPELIMAAINEIL